MHALPLISGRAQEEKEKRFPGLGRLGMPGRKRQAFEGRRPCLRLLPTLSRGRALGTTAPATATQGAGILFPSEKMVGTTGFEFLLNPAGRNCSRSVSNHLEIQRKAQLVAVGLECPERRSHQQGQDLRFGQVDDFRRQFFQVLLIFAVEVKPGDLGFRWHMQRMATRDNICH